MLERIAHSTIVSGFKEMGVGDFHLGGLGGFARASRRGCRCQRLSGPEKLTNAGVVRDVELALKLAMDVSGSRMRSSRCAFC